MWNKNETFYLNEEGLVVHDKVENVMYIVEMVEEARRNFMVDVRLIEKDSGETSHYESVDILNETVIEALENAGYTLVK